MAKKSIIPIKPHGEPREGRRALQYEVDLSNGSAVVDLVAVMLQGQLTQIPMLFVDNADNNIAVSVVMEGTLQRIVIPPNGQGYVNLLLPQNPRVGFSCVGSIAALNVNFLNFSVDELIWSVVSGMSGGTVTSVGLALPAEFAVSGSPVTTAGTLTGAWVNQAGNKVFASPADGSSNTPSFRALVAVDLPSLGANPIATAGPNAINGVALTYMRSDAAPAIQLGTAAQKGILQVDGTSITVVAGVISTAVNPTGANPTATAGPAAVNGAAATFMRSDAAPAIQLGTNAQKGILQVDGTSITAVAGVISTAVNPTGANPTATAGPAAVNGAAATFMRSDASPAIQLATAAQKGISQVDGTSITAAAGIISAVAALPSVKQFLAQLTANQAVVVNTFTKCIFDTFVSNNLGTQYAVATGKFTPLTAGFWLIYSFMRGQVATVVQSMTISITKNGTWPGTGTQLCFSTGSSPSSFSNSDTPFAFAIASMNGSTDFIEIDGRVVGTGGSDAFLGGQCFLGAAYMGPP